MKRSDSFARPLSFWLGISLLCLLPLAAHSQAPETPDVPSPLPVTFESWVEEEMQRWEIPGLAMAIVHEGEIVYAEGFGVRRKGDPEPVDEHTIFGIASVSKSMTAAALGLLVDEGLLDWDDPVTDYIPWFRLSDPWAGSEVTIRDLLVHRVGVGRIMGNRLQFMTSESREELMYRMRYHEFEEPFRSGYVYSNAMYLVAGEVVSSVTGLTWDEFLRQRLFEPLGMERSNTSIRDLDGKQNVAWPHQSIEDSVKAIPRRSWDNAAPAGGVNASVTDVARWLSLQLPPAGEFNGQRLLSRTVMREIHRPQVALPLTDPYGSQVSYGLGWRIYDYEGQRVLSHGGATDGMNTQTAFLPEHDLGIVVTSNVFTNYLDALVNTVIDHWFDMPKRDWSELYFTRYTHRLEEAMERRRQIEESRIPDTSPTHPTDRYTGIYEHDLYGLAEIRRTREGLQLRLWRDDDMIADLEHWHHDTWKIVWRNRALREEFLHFTLGQDGWVHKLNIEFVLRPLLLQAGAYPSDYTRTVPFEKEGR